MIQVPQTQGVKYAGSKLRLIPQILAAVAPLEVKTVLDAFARTTLRYAIEKMPDEERNYWMRL